MNQKWPIFWPTFWTFFDSFFGQKMAKKRVQKMSKMTFWSHSVNSYWTNFAKFQFFGFLKNEKIQDQILIFFEILKKTEKNENGVLHPRFKGVKNPFFDTLVLVAFPIFFPNVLVKKRGQKWVKNPYFLTKNKLRPPMFCKKECFFIHC